MQQIIEQLNHWIVKVPTELNPMSEAELSLKPQPHKWLKKEIMGHLCDSAIANLDRFIKIQYEKQPFVFSSYNQDQWVERQNYQDTPLEEIIGLWISLNKRIVTVISRIPNEKLLYQCEIGNQEMQTLEWLIQDYLEHMDHHLKDQVFI
ncbi:hypothetical protein J6TS2_27580 [Heyndrickxia sporothermodurans]|nr:hypothetical protein J6TS2_27580 [Heyndrickxia sporothermodurans]